MIKKVNSDMEKELISNAEFLEFLESEAEEFLSNKIICTPSRIKVKIGNQSKTFSNCTFNNGFELTNENEIYVLYFNNCVFNFKTTNQYRFLLIANHVEFDSCKFFSLAVFSNCNISFLSFIDCEFISKMRFDKGEIGNFTIYSSDNEQRITKLSSLILIDVSINIMKLQDLSVTNRLEFHYKAPNNLTINNGFYERILINSVAVVNNITIRSQNDTPLIINSLNTPHLDINGQLFLKNLHLNDWDFKSYNSIGGVIKVLNTSFFGRVNLTDSILNNVVLNKVNLSMSTPVFDGSYIEKAVLSNVTWPENHSVSTDITQDIEKHRIKADVYRQLKNNAKNSSNTIDALKFYRNEMDEYWKYIKSSKQETRANRFLIRINKWTSDFGQNFWWPLGWLFGFQLVFFSILVFSNYKGFNFRLASDTSEMSWDALSLGFGEFLKLLNPTHGMNEHMVEWRVIIDLLMRISAGFFIYQFIRATRKFARI